MTSSLRDALRESGALNHFKPVEREVGKNKQGPSGQGAGKPAHAGKSARPGKHRQQQGQRTAEPKKLRSQEEIDLAKAYALRARVEQREREEKLRAEQAAAERRRAQRAQVQALLDGATLNRAEAEIPRHFEYGGKIRRVYVDDDQLAQVNDGRLGVIQMRGRYFLVERERAERIRGVDVHAVALLVDPDSDDKADSEG